MYCRGIKKYLFTLPIIFLFSCKKECKECYFIEKDSNGSTTLESYLGEMCGKEIKETENFDWNSVDPDTECYNECR